MQKSRVRSPRQLGKVAGLLFTRHWRYMGPLNNKVVPIPRQAYAAKRRSWANVSSFAFTLNCFFDREPPILTSSALTILHEAFGTCRTHDSPIIDTPRSSPTISSFDLLSRSCRCIYGGGGENRTPVQLPISSLQRILYLTNCVSILVFKTLVKQLLIQFTLLLRIVVDCRLIEFLNKIFGFHRAVSI